MYVRAYKTHGCCLLLYLPSPDFRGLEKNVESGADHPLYGIRKLKQYHCVSKAYSGVYTPRAA